MSDQLRHRDEFHLVQNRPNQHQRHRYKRHTFENSHLSLGSSSSDVADIIGRTCSIEKATKSEQFDRLNEPQQQQTHQKWRSSRSPETFSSRPLPTSGSSNNLVFDSISLGHNCDQGIENLMNLANPPFDHNRIDRSSTASISSNMIRYALLSTPGVRMSPRTDFDFEFVFHWDGSVAGRTLNGSGGQKLLGELLVSALDFVSVKEGVPLYTSNLLIPKVWSTFPETGTPKQSAPVDNVLQEPEITKARGSIMQSMVMWQHGASNEDVAHCPDLNSGDLPEVWNSEQSETSKRLPSASVGSPTLEATTDPIDLFDRSRSFANRGNMIGGASVCEGSVKASACNSTPDSKPALENKIFNNTHVLESNESPMPDISPHPPRVVCFDSASCQFSEPESPGNIRLQPNPSPSRPLDRTAWKNASKRLNLGESASFFLPILHCLDRTESTSFCLPPEWTEAFVTKSTYLEGNMSKRSDTRNKDPIDYSIDNETDILNKFALRKPSAMSEMVLVSATEQWEQLEKQETTKAECCNSCGMDTDLTRILLRSPWCHGQSSDYRIMQPEWVVDFSFDSATCVRCDFCRSLWHISCLPSVSTFKNEPLIPPPPPLPSTECNERAPESGRSLSEASPSTRTKDCGGVQWKRDDISVSIQSLPTVAKIPIVLQNPDIARSVLPSPTQPRAISLGRNHTNIHSHSNVAVSNQTCQNSSTGGLSIAVTAEAVHCRFSPSKWVPPPRLPNSRTPPIVEKSAGKRFPLLRSKWRCPNHPVTRGSGLAPGTKMWRWVRNEKDDLCARVADRKAAYRLRILMRRTRENADNAGSSSDLDSSGQENDERALGNSSASSPTNLKGRRQNSLSALRPKTSEFDENAMIIDFSHLAEGGVGATVAVRKAQSEIQIIDDFLKRVHPRGPSYDPQPRKRLENKSEQ